MRFSVIKMLEKDLQKIKGQLRSKKASTSISRTEYNFIP